MAARRLALVLGSACAFAPRAPAWAARSLVAPRMSAVDDEPALRCGHGYDIHRMAPRDECPDGQPLVIGGVRFDGSPGHAADFELGCVAHSDGDVIYHSVVDAILGALTLPDIGQLFPDNDPRLRGADSQIFMEEAYKRMGERGYRIGNCDVTLILQKPKVNVEHEGVHVKNRMKENLVRLLHTGSDGAKRHAAARRRAHSSHHMVMAVACLLHATSVMCCQNTRCQKRR